MTRARLARGITRTPTGWRISIGAAGKFRKRLPANWTEAEVLEERGKLLKAQIAGRQDARPGTLRNDVANYLRDHVGQRPCREERERHLDLWLDALEADEPRARVTTDAIARTLNQWKDSGLSADTCNKRRTALLAFFNALEGKGGHNPVRAVPKFRVDPPVARGLPYPLIEKALRSLPKCRTRARLKLMAYTGARPVQIMRLSPDDWDDKRHTLLLHATAKGRGTKPYRVPLSTDAQAAMREFEDTDAWGTFTLAPLGRMWKAAAIKAGLPKDVKPYDLRHSFGTEIYRQTGDIRATKDMLGHSSVAMTERYTLAAVPERLVVAVRAFEKRAKVPTQVPKKRKPARKAG